MLQQEQSSEWTQAELELSRRAFLKMAGFSFLGALAGCQRAPVQNAVPPLVQAENVIPGRSLTYASTCGGCQAGCGILVKNRDGRPIKLEGNPSHPLSLGGLCAAGQASILGLYDSQRLQHPLKNGERAAWTTVDADIRAQLDIIRRERKAVRFLSDTITSPATRHTIADFLATFPNNRPRHVVHDPLSSSAILEAHQRTHGVRALPSYRLDRAEVIVSFDADFLGTWIAPVAFAAAYQAGRFLQGPVPHLSYHVQFESRLSLTGSKADQRLCIAPGELGLVMTQLAARVARRAGHEWGAALPESSVPAGFLDDLANRLWAARGRCLVLCGSQDVGEQLVCNFLNHLLENYDATLDVTHPSYQSQANDHHVHDLIEELNRGDVGALFVYRSNPVYDLPAALAESLRNVPLLVSFSPRRDETAGLSRFVCPEPHCLETWNDAEAVDGVVSVYQPVLERLGDTRSLLDTLAVWMGRPRSAYEQLREHWRTRIHPRSLITVTFEEFWDQAVHDGWVRVRNQSDPVVPGASTIGLLGSPLGQGPLSAASALFPDRSSSQPAMVRLYNPGAVIAPIRQARTVAADSFTAVLYAKVGMLNGSHAYNPWLQELPDPISKVTWDNYACLSPAAASRLEVRQGDVVRLEGFEGLDLPVLIQPGQHDEVVAIALGYGSKLSERFAKIGPPWLEARSTVGDNGMVGVNAARLLSWQEHVLRYQRDGIGLVKTGRQHPLACTQQEPVIRQPLPMAGGRQPLPIVRETVLPAFLRAAPEPAAERHDLWPDDHAIPVTGPRWGMAIDLNGCTGCSACVIACQVENNIPVVGKDEVRRHREMHWLRIDRYYSNPARSPVDGEPTRSTEVNVAHQPMLCQQCGNAPCETVCPVLATVHSEEGLNQQVYNRCVGTRYCANNCPYKVRRFNWFDYAHDDQLQNLVLNPDVTVRSRGVMEKCTFCVQRIQEGKIEARRLGLPVADGDIQTACQQSCPTKVIVFGDLNDPQSKAAQLARSTRAYKVLEELNVLPAVSYLAIVRNRQEGGRE